MRSSVKVGPTKKAPKPDPRPQLPGKQCPNCGEEREQPDPGDHGTWPGWAKWVDFPHENPFDCIRFLKKSLDRTKDDLHSVEREVESIDAPRNERC